MTTRLTPGALALMASRMPLVPLSAGSMTSLTPSADSSRARAPGQYGLEESISRTASSMGNSLKL